MAARARQKMRPARLMGAAYGVVRSMIVSRWGVSVSNLRAGVRPGQVLREVRRSGGRDLGEPDSHVGISWTGRYGFFFGSVGLAGSIGGLTSIGGGPSPTF